MCFLRCGGRCGGLPGTSRPPRLSWEPHFIRCIQAQRELAKLGALSLDTNAPCLLGVGKAVRGIYFMGCLLLSPMSRSLCANNPG